MSYKATKTFYTYRVNIMGPHGHVHVPNNSFRDSDEREARRQAIERAKECAVSKEFADVRRSKCFNVFIDMTKEVHETSKYTLKDGDF